MTRSRRAAAALLMGIGFIVLSQVQTTVDQTASAATPRLTLRFEAEQSLAGQPVGYTVRGRGCLMRIAPASYRIDLAVPAVGAQTSDAAATRTRAVSPGMRRLTVAFEDAQPEARLVALERLPGVSHHLVGPRHAWRRDVPAHGRITAKQVYPNVDVTYYGIEGDLEYDFVVGPGGNPDAIRMRIDGADRLQVEESGDLLLETGAATFRLKAPVAYQERNGQRRVVNAAYRVEGRVVTFALGTYDRHETLVIDPALRYGSYLGGFVDGSQSATHVAADASGNLYVGGYTASQLFPTTALAYQPESGSAPPISWFDAFVTKFGADGQVVWSTYIGTEGTELSKGMDLDASGAVYLAGYTGGGDWPTTPGAFQEQPASLTAEDVFVVKLSPDGSSLLYSTLLGGSSWEQTWDIDVDANGQACVVGISGSSDFPLKNAAQGSLAGTGSPFITKLSADGTSLVYSTYYGGTGQSETCTAVEQDASGAAYVVGWTDSADWPTVGAYQSTIGADAPGEAVGRDVFLLKLDVTGSVDYATFLGGKHYDIGRGVALAAGGGVIVVGETRSSDYPTTSGAYRSRFINGKSLANAFITAVDASGTSLSWSTFLGGKGSDSAFAVDLDGAGRVHVVGMTASDNFPTIGAIQADRSGSFDAFVATLSADGSSLVFSTYLGGSDYEEGQGIALASNDVIYVSGRTQSGDFPVTPDAHQPTDEGAREMAFVAMIDLAAAGGGGGGGGGGGNGKGHGKPPK